MIECNVEKVRGHRLVRTSFRCAKGSILALTGPSGAGKTTVIRMLAGLETPDRGVIVNQGRVLFDSRKKVNLPTRRRGVGYVFQEHTLFPHLSLERNVGFSCSDKGRALELLEIMGIAHLAKRKPHQVSGGERQRAAISQALASNPSLLLLDEPFSALDKKTRKILRDQMLRMKGMLDIPVILVTHDQEDARILSDINVTLPDTLCTDKSTVAKNNLLHWNWNSWKQDAFPCG